MSRTPWAELGLTTALLLNACGPAKSSGTEKPVGGDGVGQTAENLPIPTPNVITNSEGEIRYPTETYFASKLNVCVAHPFSKTGGAEMPSILVSCKPIPNLEANEVALRGDLVDIPENGFIAFTDNQGNDGYLNKETVMMSLQEIQTWVAGMSLSQVEKEVVGKVLGEARVTGENISVVFRQTLHTERDPNGDERLVDIGLSIGFQAGTKVSILDDTLQPFGKTDLLKDLQIAGVDVVANQVDLDEFILNVYPSDWIEVGGGSWVSPEFFELQSQIAASGERLTLLSDGTIQDGATTVPGLFVDKNGTITLQIGGKDNYVILRVESLSFDDTKGVNVAGYTLDEATGLWRVERPIKEFPWCKDFSKFAEYPVAFADLQEQGRFVQSSLTEDLFDPSKFNNVSIFVVVPGVIGSVIIPNPDTAPNYTIRGSSQFLKDFMCGITTDSDGESYMLTQVPYYVEGVPANQWPVMTGLFHVPSDRRGAWPIVASRFSTGMNVVPWRVDADSRDLATQFVNPKTGNNFTTIEVNTIVEEMKQGNFSNVDGLVLLFDIAKSSAHWYE